LARWDNDDVSRANEASFVLRCDDALSFYDVENLVGRVYMWPGPRSRLEENHDEV